MDGNRVLIATPIKLGQLLHSSVVAGVAAQSVKADWVLSTCTGDFHGNREANINVNRSQLQKQVFGYGLHYSDVIILLDSDVVITSPDCFERLINALDCDLICAASMTKPNDTGDHIVTACAAIRYEHYMLIDYLAKGTQCQCGKIAELGRVDYVQGIAAYEIPREPRRQEPKKLN